ncbi:PQQ-binding-like beta-propeller repeat protein [Algoriphagus sp. C2-6-M1]|uniref:outer membrane protein assembly factor BamB family protein n=1 Tax=Algoriphagus persicinus TaxID=3108754 RepID=UPI002B3CE8EA|nr:PQQ-binding-like beta-propeller repeat protein [Algoriphagus sp. C2-6-M1]MEB2779298.1 PQQ-binding-like beta-propeller repeat protein [Algoriphagus sp. C2-6-M1]
MIKYIKSVLLLALSLLFIQCSWHTNADWPEYYGDGARSHYSMLEQIDTSNVSKLKIAWTYSSGGADTIRNRSQIQSNPIIIDGVLYGVSAATEAFAIESDSGKELWKTDIKENEGTTSRGVTYWSHEGDKRIFFGAGRWLYALDAGTGKLIETFGKQGRIDLKVGIDRPGADNYVTSNTPNTIYKDLIITGSRVSESESALLGDIRAYDARDGSLAWIFHTIPEEDEAGYETWFPTNPRQRLGGANSWMGMAIDRERGIVYVPTGSAAFDFYGGNRKGDNLYANSLLALNANDGKLLWHYQVVHHDIWDRDLPAPPNLFTITRDDKKIDVVSVITKQGYTFIFDRVTGKHIYPIEEVAFPQEAASGEYPSPTQPIPTKPAPFTRQSFTSNDFNSFVANKDSLIDILVQANTGSPYTPITEKMTIIYPGTDGGGQWGGAATDPAGVLYIPAKEIPVYTSLILRSNESDQLASSENTLYNLYCSNCHGKDLNGSHDGSYPGLRNIKTRLTRDQLLTLMGNGRGMMPSFSHISMSERDAIANFLLDLDVDKEVEAKQNNFSAYQHTGYNRWYDTNGYPVNAPPWGTLTAIDGNTGQRRWQVPLGEYKELTAKGVSPTGTDNYGGPLVTAGGLIFIAATPDEKIRAFKKSTGELVWEHELPAAGYATPSTYRINGKQYIVIACGGGKLKSKSGDKYVAFSLED